MTERPAKDAHKSTDEKVASEDVEGKGSHEKEISDKSVKEEDFSGAETKRPSIHVHFESEPVESRVELEKISAGDAHHVWYSQRELADIKQQTNRTTALMSRGRKKFLNTDKTPRGLETQTPKGWEEAKARRQASVKAVLEEQANRRKEKEDLVNESLEKDSAADGDTTGTASSRRDSTQYLEDLAEIYRQQTKKDAIAAYSRARSDRQAANTAFRDEDGN